MDSSDLNGDMEGKPLTRDFEEVEETGGLLAEVNGEIQRIEKSTLNQESDEEEVSRTSDFEEEVDDISDDCLKGNETTELDVSDHEAEFEELVGEDRQETADTSYDYQEASRTSDLDEEEVHEHYNIPTVEISEVPKVAEELEVSEESEIVEEHQEVTYRSDEEEDVPPKKTLHFDHTSTDDLELSDDQDDSLDRDDPEEEREPEFAEEEQSIPDIVDTVPDTAEEEEPVETKDNSQVKEVEEEETNEPFQIVETKDLIETKEEVKESIREEPPKEKEELFKRRGSTENFQKLKDRFKVEENNIKNNNEKENRKSATNMSDAKSKRFGGTSEKCSQCNKTVYPMEKMEVAGRVLHKTCFKCCKCNSQLNVGRFSIGGKDMYCMTHYKQAFREKGTYDVFTPDNPIKGKWENKALE